MQGLNPPLKKILNNNPTAKITSFTICRHEIDKIKMRLVKAFVDTKDTKIYYHLYLLVHLDNGKTFQFEKNPSINIRKKNEKAKQVIEISTIPQPITMLELLEKTKEIMGNKYLGYQGHNNNCQLFVLSLVQAAGVLTEQHRAFIKQETTDLFHGKPLLRKFSSLIIASIQSKGGNLIDDKPKKNSWIKHVQEYSIKHNVPYREAMKKAAATYKK